MSDNDNLELKKRSRRRLVGAAALALIAAILLPMVMDDEPTAPVNDIQVTIPDRSLDSRPIGMPEPEFVITPDLPPVAGDGSSAVGVSPIAESAEAEQALRPVEPLPSSRPATPSLAPPAASAPSAPLSAPPAPVKPDVRSSESAEEARARAILEGRSGAVAGAPNVPAQQFVVQVGAFSDTSKASSRQIELAARGFRSYVETSDGVTRVRVGPYASRADAEAMLKKLKDASIDGVVSTR